MGGFFTAHEPVLNRAVAAIRARGWWSAYPEIPSGRSYGETAKADAEAAFQALLNRPFALDQPADAGRVGEERSPWGFPLGITYPRARAETLVAAARAAGEGWAKASVQDRVRACLE